MRLSGSLTTVAELTTDDRAAMLALMQRHYENVVPGVFRADLEEKRWAIVVRDETTDAIRGFSTQTLLRGEVDGQSFTTLFSGDTIIDRDCWGDPALSHVWGRLALALIDRYEGIPLYWFLLSQGYRTYRFLPLFFHEYYPRHDLPTPHWVKQAIDALAGERYPESYDTSAGVVRSLPRQYRLRAGVADITAERLRDPHVRHFARLNPSHVRGDELCCLAPLSRENFTRAAYRVIGSEMLALELT